ncbi:MAG TPA: transporter, partial [Dysgonomonas sp.]|nr:transporter [Dysgonomonas sp.]
MQLKNIRSYMMPVSMTIGIIFSLPLSKFSFITTYLIFVMLLISYTNISLKDVRFKILHLYLLCIQLFGSIILYTILRYAAPDIAQGAMMCVLAPTATSAVVITGMLGGNTASLTAYSLLSNFAVAISAPIFFSLLGNNPDITFFDELFLIARQVFVILLLPFVLSIILKAIFPVVHQKIRKAQWISFVLWNVALTVVTAKIVQFLWIEGRAHFDTAIVLFFFVSLVCAFQFYIGRKLGKHYGDTIAGGQGLGQKNTVLSIWMAQSYLDPISPIGPGAYILWQNIINSYL